MSSQPEVSGRPNATPGLDLAIHVVGKRKPGNSLMLSLSKYEVAALVLRQAQDEGSVGGVFG